MTTTPVPPEKPTDEHATEPDNTNYAVGIAIGLPVGIALGLTVFDNVAIGALIGLAFAPVFAGFAKWKNESDKT